MHLCIFLRNLNFLSIFLSLYSSFFLFFIKAFSSEIIKFDVNENKICFREAILTLAML